MSKKLMLLAAGALTALAFAAFPVAASAGEPQVHCPNGVAECEVEMEGLNPELTKAGSPSVRCAKVVGKGTAGTTTGSLQLTFTGCKDSLFSLACTGVSPAVVNSGEIKTTVLTSHNIYTTDNKTSPGVLLTPNNGHFSTFKCADGTHTVGGNGVIGTLTTSCGATSASLAIDFQQSAAGNQLHKQITGTGATFDLLDSVNGGANVTAAQIGSGTVKPVGGGNFTVTCV